VLNAQESSKPKGQDLNTIAPFTGHVPNTSVKAHAARLKVMSTGNRIRVKDLRFLSLFHLLVVVAAKVAAAFNHIP